MRLKLSFFFWIILIGFFVLSLRFFFSPYLWHFHDEMQPFWLYEWVKGFQLNQFPIRWAPDLVWGAGYPLFTFLYPLPYYLGGILVLSGFSLGTSFKLYIFIIQLIGLISFNLALFRFKKPNNLTNTLLLLITNFIFLAFPYRALNIYVRGALGEITLYFSIPLFLFSHFSYLKTQNKNYLYLTALSYALIILSHNIGAYIFIPILFLISLTPGVRQASDPRGQIKALLLGLGLSAFFWLPALWQKSLMVDNPIFNIADHFPFIKQLIWSPWGYGASRWRINDDLSFQLGPSSWLALLTIFIFTAYQLITYRRLNRFNLFLLAIIAITFYLLNIRSLWLWNTIPLLNYFQFPWRLLIILNFFLPLSFFFTFLNTKSAKLISFISLPIILLSTLQIILFFKPQQKVILNNQYFFERYLPTGSLYHQNSEEYLRLPQNTTRPLSLPPLITTLNSDTKLTLINNSFSNLTINLTNTKPETITIRRLYFPSWQITDNNQIITYTSNPNGLITFTLPPGKHTINITLHQTPIEKIANFISLLTLILTLALITIPDRDKLQAL